MFKNKRQEFYFKTNEPLLENAIEFAVPTEAIYNELRKKLVLLIEQKGSFEIEKPLNDKSLSIFPNVGELIEAIKKVLDYNFSEYSTEFKNEPLGFVYYLGNQILFSNSVEILQKIYNKETDDVGNLHYSLVIKCFKGEYYFWNW